jgi:uncharacterized membrane protein
MTNGNPFGIEDEGKTAGMLSYFFVLGWSMAFFAFHQYERNRLSSFHMRQTLLLYMAYVVIHYGVPVLFGVIGLPVVLFSSIYFIIPLNLLFVGLWSIGLNGASKGEETPIPVFGEPAQRIFANIF